MNSLSFFKGKCKAGTPASCFDKITINKPSNIDNPLVTFVLLDWNCRENFYALDWLNRQSVSRTTFELIWIDLYYRVAEEALQKADAVVTCHQKGMYHKHKGYNIGVLLAKGKIVIICDSDAVFPENFVRTVIDNYGMAEGKEPKELILMFHERRTSATYPNMGLLLDGISERYEWWPLVPNVGACACFRREDIIKFGGFDEADCFKGYMCGAYDLVWRLVNAGFREEWYPAEKVALWHFAHPDPVTTKTFLPSFRSSLENTRPHADGHALAAVEAFALGRVLPQKENSQIWNLRMQSRKIGTDFERNYAFCLPYEGVPIYKKIMMHAYSRLHAILFVPYKYIQKIGCHMIARGNNG